MKDKDSLYLPIKQVFFDQIVAGTKKEEYREIWDTTYKKYLQTSPEGNIYFDDQLASIDNPLTGDPFFYNKGVFPYFPIPYKTLSLAVGYSKERDTAVVEIENITFEPAMKDGKIVHFKMNEEGNAVLTSEETELCVWVIVYHLGKVVSVHRK